MKNITRRSFFEKSLLIGAGSFIAPSLLQTQTVKAAQEPRWTGKNDISLAQWALVDEINAGKWKTLDFSKKSSFRNYQHLNETIK